MEVYELNNIQKSNSLKLMRKLRILLTRVLFNYFVDKVVFQIHFTILSIFSLDEDVRYYFRYFFLPFSLCKRVLLINLNSSIGEKAAEIFKEEKNHLARHDVLN